MSIERNTHASTDTVLYEGDSSITLSELKEVRHQVAEKRQARNALLTNVATVLRALEARMIAANDDDASIGNMIDEGGPVDNERGDK